MGFFIAHGAMAAEGDGGADDCYLDGWQYSLQCSRITVGKGDTQVKLAVMVSPALDESGEEPLYLLAGGLDRRRVILQSC
uniref:hypothetical protein n=1 Tax=Microbulbifer sp. MLAF003 TaxID=3032582 RepID=UPI0024AE7EE5|nr:hypothetical protein [Microbulbifer sp. MLAF003]WHI50810.1 hypothetical protein P3339_20680 [Microbulbifer sp. MLAF003]